MTTERYMNLFRGYEKRFGQYTIHGEADNGKQEGQAQTLDRSIRDKDYESHLAGKAGMGIVPLREDNTIHFAAIDLDEYPGSDKFKVPRKDDESDDLYRKRVAKEHKDWADGICIAIRDENLVATWSKSGGLHLWLFSREGIAASVVIDYLKNVAHRLGHGGCEIFPKQSTRHSEQDVGNWINLPYFGNTRKARIVIETDIGFDVKDVDFDMFLKVAETYAEQVTEGELESANDNAAKEIGAPTEKWYDGPPCLQRLIIGDPRRVKQLREAHEKKVRDGEYETEAAEKRGADWVKVQESKLKPELAGGARNTVFFNVALYLARRELNVFDGKPNKAEFDRLEQELMNAHEEWATATGQQGLPRAELKILAKQGLKDGWNYTCKQSPLKDFCASKKCAARNYGIGSRSDDIATPLEGFTVVTSKPPVFYVEVAGERVQLISEDLVEQRKFGLALMKQARFVWEPVQTAKYTQMVSQLMATATYVDPPSEMDMREDVAAHLLDYLRRNGVPRATGHDKKFVEAGKPLLASDGKSALFKVHRFQDYAATKGIKMTKPELIHMLTHEFSAREVTTTLEDRKSPRGYKVELDVLRERVL